MAAGNAIDLDGTDDRVAVGGVHDFAGTASFTLEAWVEPDAVGNGPYVGQKVDGSDGWGVNITTSGGLRAFRRASGSTDSLVSSSTPISTGAWVHVAATYDGSTLRVYLDGSLDGSLSSSVSLPNTTLEFAIGGRDPGSQDLNGRIDEVRIWDHARTQAQIADNMLLEVDPGATGLIGYYKFDEASGDALDSSPTGADGTLEGDATRASAAGRPFGALLGQVAEADDSQDVTASRTHDLEAPQETDAALAVGSVKVSELAAAAELDASRQMLIVTGLSGQVGQVLETDAPRPLDSAKVEGLQRANEADQSRTITPARLVDLLRALESDAALGLTPEKPTDVSQVLETDLARTLQRVALLLTFAFTLEDSPHEMELRPLRHEMELEPL